MQTVIASAKWKRCHASEEVACSPATVSSVTMERRVQGVRKWLCHCGKTTVTSPPVETGAREAASRGEHNSVWGETGGALRQWQRGWSYAGLESHCTSSGSQEARGDFKTVTWRGKVSPTSRVEDLIHSWLAEDGQSPKTPQLKPHDLLHSIHKLLTIATLWPSEISSPAGPSLSDAFQGNELYKYIWLRQSIKKGNRSHLSAGFLGALPYCCP